MNPFKKLFHSGLFLLRHVRHLGLIPGLRFALAYRLRKSGTHIKLHKNKHAITLRARSSDIHVYEDTFLWKHYDLPYPDGPTTIIDAGAHIGLASIDFARRFPEATIIALEPHPENFALLQANTHSHANIHPINAALWPTEGSLEITNPEAGTWSFQCHANQNGDIKALTIPSLLAQFQIDSLDLLKIDIEGAEKELFAANYEWLKHVTSIIVELHDDLVPGCSRNFYQATQNFPHEARNQENILVSQRPLSKA